MGEHGRIRRIDRGDALLGGEPERGFAKGVELGVGEVVCDQPEDCVQIEQVIMKALRVMGDQRDKSRGIERERWKVLADRGVFGKQRKLWRKQRKGRLVGGAWGEEKSTVVLGILGERIKVLIMRKKQRQAGKGFAFVFGCVC